MNVNISSTDDFVAGVGAGAANKSTTVLSFVSGVVTVAAAAAAVAAVVVGAGVGAAGGATVAATVFTSGVG